MVICTTLGLRVMMRLIASMIPWMISFSAIAHHLPVVSGSPDPHVVPPLAARVFIPYRTQFLPYAGIGIGSAQVQLNGGCVHSGAYSGVKSAFPYSSTP